ncbi:phage/plasmid primase, P4 family [uncultured Exiguobacterium sp.]|uniref:DNA primase family protein n=1 Tax=uncultured Exiguobacterium sp. TaxID=202669 RepID=UPI0037484EA2
MSKMDGSLLRGFDRIENVCREIEFDTKEKITSPFSISDTQIKTVNNSYLRTEQSEKYLPHNKTSVSVSNDQLAKILMENNIFLNVNNSLYHWVNQKGHYVGMTTEYADKFIRQEIPEKYRYKINSNCIREIVQWIKSYIDAAEETDLLANKKHLVAFTNGIFNFNMGSFSSHDSSYFFTSVINADYNTNVKNQGYHFDKFIKDLTGNDHELYLRVQELFGYVLSEIRTVKFIPYLIGPKDTGKSIVLKILEHLVGMEAFTNMSFDQLNKPEYLSQLLGKRLNTCGETSEFKLSKLDIFKKLSGGDYVTARPIYGQPVNFVNSAVLVFAGNHLPKVNGLDKSNAFSQRIVVFPFYNPIPKERQDTNLLDKLLEEKDYIVQWAIKGLLRWSNNNYQFTSSPESIKLSLAYTEQNNSIDTFIKERCTNHPYDQVYKDDFISAYINYCIDIDVIPESKFTIHEYMKSLSEVSYKRYRDGLGNNKYGYIGLSLIHDNEEES